jgi:regulation of enolase protein 1 (concanavalin A-like superfamily)
MQLATLGVEDRANIPFVWGQLLFDGTSMSSIMLKDMAKCCGITTDDPAVTSSVVTKSYSDCDATNLEQYIRVRIRIRAGRGTDGYR